MISFRLHKKAHETRFFALSNSFGLLLIDLLWEMEKFTVQFYIFEVTCEFLDLDNLFNSRLDIELLGNLSEFARLKLCHPKNVLDMEQEQLG